MSAVSVIEQEPIYPQVPAGLPLIFVVSNDTAVAGELKVKFIAEVHVSSTTPVDLSNTNDLVASFKSTPNNAGVGMFDFRAVLENYVSADNMAADGSKYKLDITDAQHRHPMHLINQFSLNNNSVKYFAIKFAVEYLGADDGVNPVDPNVVRTQSGTEINSDAFMIVNSYIKHTDELYLFNDDFGYNFQDFYPASNIPFSSVRKLFTNAPTTQYANDNDYGTVALFIPDLSPANNAVNVQFNYYDSSNSFLNTETVTKDVSTGAYLTWDTDIKKQMIFLGCYPANLRNWSTIFQGLVSAGTIHGGRIQVTINDNSSGSIRPLNIYVNCPDLKGYEPIRLCWLNQWGAWDYYTFNKKSTKSIKTKGSTYNQLEGTWNETAYRLDSYRGGKKTFRVNSTENIKMNTDYVTEDENIMFEELINSPEVYELTGFKTDVLTAFNTYVTPVRLTTSSFTRKTVANDKLIQYTFEIEKTKKLRTQSV